MDTFEDKVNAVVGQFTQDDNGNLTLPEGVDAPEEVLFAAKLEKRRRDTQSAYTRAQQALKQKEAEANALAEAWEADAAGSMSEIERNELEELKHTDPDKWRARITELERAKRAKFAERKQQVAQKAVQETELEARARQFEEFTAANPGIELTDEVIANDIPPRFVKQLEKGEVTFEQFLVKCGEYLSKGKVVSKGDTPPDMADLSAQPGGGKPHADSAEKSIVQSYRNEVF